jgi:type II secretory pathway pseudopilin PulG
MALVGKAVRSRSRRALTLVEVLIVLFVLVLVVAAVLPLMGNRHHGNHQLKDGTQIRNIIQAMTIFAQGNKDAYPVPQNLDVNNQTVAVGIAGDASTQWAKNNTSNILSILIFNSSISPELCYSPAESNSLIRIDSAFENSNPAKAAVPANAVWDPGFCAYVGEPVGGGNRRDAGISGSSYASLVFNLGNRAGKWSNTFNATEAVFGNRGASYGQADELPWNPSWKLVPGEFGTQSNTLAILGGRTTWEGFIGYNDNHVNFETRPDPAEITFTRASGTPRVVPDNFFVDETDENVDAHARGNAYMRPFVTVKQDATGSQVAVFRD